MKAQPGTTVNTINLPGCAPVPLALRAFAARRASTGPRSFERGKSNLLLSGWLSGLCFNGAARLSHRSKKFVILQNEAQDRNYKNILTDLTIPFNLLLVERTTSVFRCRARLDSPYGKSVCKSRALGSRRRGSDDCFSEGGNNSPAASPRNQP